METQKEAIDRIEKKSSRNAYLAPGSVPRLLIVPQLKLFVSLFLKGRIFMGVKGLKESFNEWALDFATEAKQYEKSFADDTKLINKSKDFKR